MSVKNIKNKRHSRRRVVRDNDEKKNIEHDELNKKKNNKQNNVINR